MSVEDLPRRTLRGRLFALAGVAAIVGAVMAGLWALGVFDTPEGEPAELLETPPVDGATEFGPRAGEIAPDFELSDFDGDRHRLSDFRGKPVYLNFWATWCVPCEAELPDIYRLHQEYGDDLAVIAVNWEQSADVAEEFFDSLDRLDGGEGVSFTVDGIDPSGVVYERYETIGGPPISVFIDERGIVSKLFNGQMRYEEMKAAVDAMLANG